MKKGKFVLMVMIVGLLAMLGIDRAMAYTIVQNPIPYPLNAHYKEVTITADPGEIVYLPIPRQNFPVNVRVTIPEFFTPEGGNPPNGPYAMSFVAVETQGKVSMSRPQVASSRSLDQQFVSDQSVWVYTSETSFPLATLLYAVYAPLGAEADSIEVYQQTDMFVVGVATPESGMPNRILLGILNPSRDANNIPLYGPVTFYVSASY